MKSGKAREATDEEPSNGSSPKKILVVSFSQSGQLDRIVASLLAPLRTSTSIEIIEEVLRPVTPFPFPWSAYGILDVFPEAFRGIPCPLTPLKSHADDRYDLVIPAYQVWYLAPSIPISSFLQSPEARRLLNDTPVLTIVGCRNMWFRAHEKVKDHLHAANARLIGHFVLTDKAHHLVSVITTVYRALTGRKDRMFGLFPTPGVSDQDIARCSLVGDVVSDSLSHPKFPNIQDRLNALSACKVSPHLMFMESGGAKLFDLWTSWTIERGERGDRRRRRLTRIFGCYFVCVIMLSPLLFLLFYATLPFRQSTVRRQTRQVYRY